MNYLRLACLLAVVSLPSPAFAQLRAEVVASGLTNPLGVVVDPVVPGVFYVLEQRGVVQAFRDGERQPAPFIDLRGSVLSGGERGLLGMAFPPDASTSGRVFFNFTDQNGDTVVARFRRSSGNPLVADASSRFDLRWSNGVRVIQQPFANHNGGQLAYGPDGYLYIGMGDGGSANDPNNNAQNPASLLGKMLRIDTAVDDSDPNGFQVPPDNPFVDAVPIPAAPEIWAFGYRNPWRFSFDNFGPAGTGALIVADVGQNAREELNYEPRGAGGRNYGWRIREARIATPNVPPTAPAYGPLTDPIYDYTRDQGRSITGGFVYRGGRLGAAYQGRYFFADFVSSRVWSLGLAVDPATGEATGTDVIEHTAELGGASALGGISSFGRDVQGELYLATFAGQVLRLVPASIPGAVPNPPRDLQAVISGSTVVVSWNAPREGPVPAMYQIEAGSAPGLSNLGVASAEQTDSRLTFANVPPGTYYVRLRSVGSAGISAPSNEVIVAVGATACTAAPPAPSGLAALVNGRVVRLVWGVDATADGPARQIIEAGSSPGFADLAQAAIDGIVRELTVNAPPGTYYVRIRGQNACGTGGASNEVVVRVF